jgi:hypothetical protein
VAEQTTATIATMAAIMMVAAAISHGATAAAAAVATEQTSVGLFFTADEGDTDDCEKDRNAT